MEGLVATLTGATPSRAELLDQYRQTFDDPAKVDREDCSEAILDAARVPENSMEYDEIDELPHELEADPARVQLHHAKVGQAIVTRMHGIQ